jgi:uncharacterized protein YbjT (DUF2867 family)
VRILVVGATGAQGGGVARHLLRRTGFTVRAFTRRPGSPAACELRRRGAEVVEGDLTNRATVRAALKDCYGIFGVTSFTEHLEREHALGMNLVNAVAGSAIEHFVLSALPPIDLLSTGVSHSRQCDIKARLEQYARSLQLPATYLHPAPYFETLPAILARRTGRRGDQGQERRHSLDRRDHSTLAGPSHGLPAIAAEDIGGVAAAVFTRPEQFFDRTITAVGDRRPLEQYAALMKRRASLRAGARCTPHDIQPPIETAEALADLIPLVDFLTNRHYEPGELDEGRVLHPEMHSYESWLAANAAP